jgi:hypothetical protein
MPDRRLVAADTPLYDPVTLTDKPQDVFADWPCPANGQSRPRLTCPASGHNKVASVSR